jgi:hypothetical protein
MHPETSVFFSAYRPLMRLIIATVFALLACQTALAGGVPKETFPRLGGYQIGATTFAGYDDPEYLKAMAKLDYVIIGSTQPVANDTAAGIRRLNPDAVLVKYTSLQSISSTRLGISEIARNKVNSERGPNRTNAHDWWARDLNGNHVSNWPNNWTVNITKYVQPDANGDRYPEWLAKLNHERWVQYDQWDGVYGDATFWQPRGEAASADWSGGKERNWDTIRSEFRLGHLSYWNEIQRLAPGKFVTVNHDWYRSENPSYLGRWDLPEYDQKIHGGLLELVMRSSDLEGAPRTGWNTVMTYYRRSMRYFLDPDLTMFVVLGEPDNYRFFRYSFATCLMDDGYFDYAPIGREQYGTVEWFDEFDLAGAADTSWLGLAIDAPPEGAWRSGVWRRDFEGGVALVNPQGNGVQTVTVEQGLRRIAGRQDSRVNNGQPAGSITLQDGDGIILVRENALRAPPPRPAPKPPVLRTD